MRFTEAYNYLLSLNNVSRREFMKDSARCDWYLQRVQFLLNLLGNPEKKIPHYIHVTGTSGKGSTCLMLSSILRASGKKVGLLTSPHPSTLVERWEVNGRMMTQKQLVEQVAFLKPKLDEYVRTSPYDLPSFSEIMTILSLCYFAKQKVEWAVLEVGCGGRFDSTNVIPHKDAAVITNVGLDHTEILGDTREKIAYEKAGIIKPGCMVFTAEKRPSVLKILEDECTKNKITLKRSASDTAYNQKNQLRGIDFTYQNNTYYLSALGEHQIKNAVLAIDVAESLGISNAAIYRGLAQTRFPIRCEIVLRKPFIILDGAHNEDKMRTTVETVRRFSKNIHLIVGFSATKDITTMIKLLSTLHPKTVACTRFTKNTIQKAAYPALLAEQFKKLLPRTKILTSLDPSEAVKWSRSQQKTSDLLLVTGSMYLSGELRLLFKIK